MRKMKFAVPLYEVDVTLVQVQGTEDADGVKECCEEIGLLAEDTKAVLDFVKEDKCDGADTFRNFEKGQMLVIFYRMTDERVKRNRYGHEKRHVEDRILQWCGVDDIEAAAYLAGFLSEYFDDFCFGGGHE